MGGNPAAQLPGSVRPAVMVKKNGRRSAHVRKNSAGSKRKASTMVRNQGAQAAGMSQACGRGQEKRPAIGPDPEEQLAANAKRSPWSGTRERKLQG
ncbi:hypothetical protein [Bacillus paralicheniformis]|uniref:hypothetical protein n=1 Tax=Bacillus paralicheniformis TaxID=1648923 RepID=UPI003D1FE19C